MSESFAASAVPPVLREASLADYLAIARLDHSSKHVFIIPGIMLAYLLRGVHSPSLIASVALGFVAAICIASANYTINEWLDRDSDRHHPTKSLRTAVLANLSERLVLVQWLVLVIVGLGSALLASHTMFWIGVVFAAQGIIYNVPPFRSKDKAFVDVISESINNPLRLMIGWSMVDPTTLPPSSVIIVYWLGGAFLMAAKRMSEYRQIAASHGKDLLVRYRKSFAGYSESNLLVSCFVYALLGGFFMAVFLVKYRIEYIIALPAVAVLFGQYLRLSLRADSAAQKPEKLYRERGLMLVVSSLIALFVLATLVDLPFLEPLAVQKYVSLS